MSRPIIIYPIKLWGVFTKYRSFHGWQSMWITADIE